MSSKASKKNKGSKVRKSEVPPRQSGSKLHKFLMAWGVGMILIIAVYYSTLTAGPTRVQSYEVVDSFAHDPNAYTQGLIFANGFFYESTGLKGQSSLRRVHANSGEIVQRHDLAPHFFAEGLTLYRGVLVQITWQERTGFVYNADTFELLREFRYENEGWGLTTDGQYLIMSDGSHKIYFFDYDNMKVVKTLEVMDHKKRVDRLNELEYIKGEIWANVYGTDFIVRISPKTGHVKAWLDLSGILRDEDRTGNEDVLNGIAYDEKQGRIFITGKRYGRVYQIKVKDEN